VFAHSMHVIDFNHDLVSEDCYRLTMKTPDTVITGENIGRKPFVIFHNALLVYSVGFRHMAAGGELSTSDDLRAAFESFAASQK
jgi:hypothetical protein